MKPSTIPPASQLDPLPEIIPAGSVSLISGAAGLGKTALLATFARWFRDGTPIFGHQPNPVPAIGIIAADRSWERGAAHWFERAGYPDIAHYSMQDDRSFDARSLRRKFERTMRLAEFTDRLKLPAGSLLLVDPMGLFLGGNLMDYDACAVACLEIRAMLRDRGLTLLGTAHSGKMKTDQRERYTRLQDHILGSSALLGFSDTQMVLAGPEEGQTAYTFLWLSHLAAPETFQLERGDDGIFRLATGSDRASCQQVLALLPLNGSPATFRDLVALARVIPLAQKTVQRALEQLVIDGVVVKVKHGVYCRRHVVH